MATSILDTELPDYQPSETLWRFGPEIRNIIFGQVFDNDLSNKDTLELMRASKQLHFEVGSHFYAHNLFNLSAPFVPKPGATVLPPINDRYLRFLKHLEIECEVGSATLPRVKDLAATIRKLSTIGANFRQITFLIQFPSAFSFFLQDRLDDTVMEEDHPITAAICYLLSSGVSDLIHIVLNGAWFAPGIATALKKRFNARLLFMKLDKAVGMTELEDLSIYERPLAGISSSKMCKHLDLYSGDTDELVFTKLATDLDLLETIPNPQSEEGASLRVSEADDEMEINAELTDDDDVDMEDLISLDDGEAEEIMQHLTNANNGSADQIHTKSEMQFLVNFAPEILFASSQKS